MSEYNGWPNHETWAVNLWLGNDEGSHNACCSLAAEAIEGARDHANVPRIWSAQEAAVFTLADSLKAMVEESNPLANQASMFSDLITSALSEVRWSKIAEGLLEDEDDYKALASDPDDDE